jgi:G protein-coupled receptor Mth (Methuselah protein)
MIFVTFRSGMRGRGGKDQKRFIFYCLYAFGVPIILTLIIIIIDKTQFIPESFRPNMGVNRCWIEPKHLVEFIYVYFPISIILVINVVFFSMTARNIFRIQKETSVVRSSGSQKHSKIDADKDRFFLRLFIIMGASWCMESVSWAFESYWNFYISDILNCLQGFIIFLLFVWKPKVRKLVMKR